MAKPISSGLVPANGHLHKIHARKCDSTEPERPAGSVCLSWLAYGICQDLQAVMLLNSESASLIRVCRDHVMIDIATSSLYSMPGHGIPKHLKHTQHKVKFNSRLSQALAHITFARSTFQCMKTIQFNTAYGISYRIQVW